MTPLDVGMAAAGRLATTLDRRVSRRGTSLIVIGLVTFSGIWTYLIGSSPRPTDLTFEDVRTGSIPAMTSWVRIEGDLRPYPNSDSLYELHDIAEPSLYLIVISDAPLLLGHQVMTGQISPTTGETTGNIGSLDPDIPAVPKQNEPFAIIWLPAGVAAMILLGQRLGYPVVRRERPKLLHAPPLAPGERLRAQRSGRIESDEVSPADAVPCAVEVRRGDETHGLVLIDDAEAGGDRPAEQVVRVRRSVPVVWLKVCRTNGCDRGVLVHAQAADLVLVFNERTERDRLVTSLG
jgi:hypothetical protein